MHSPSAERYVAIACGGTGGHLYPGIAIGEKLLERGCEVALLVSNKEVDRTGASSGNGMTMISLPAVPLLKGNFPAFLRGFWQSFLQMRAHFRQRRPAAVLAMGSFTSAGPILAGRLCRARTALHESNSIPGRANRVLAPWVDHAFIGFASAANHLGSRSIQFTGTPVRSQFQTADAAACRLALGLDPNLPLVLVMGGSQGASAINQAMLEAIPFLARSPAGVQVLHLTGTANFEAIAERYRQLPVRAKVLPFLSEMELALGAASVAVSRAGASSLAELAALQLPSILIPYPAAADDHQYHNARAFAQRGAARMMVQSQLRAGPLAASILELATDSFLAEQMRAELAKWHYPDSADQIARALVPEETPQFQAEPQAGLLRFRPG